METDKVIEDTNSNSQVQNIYYYRNFNLDLRIDFILILSYRDFSLF